MRSRNKERISARQNGGGNGEKIGHVPRSAVTGMKQSGLTSTNRTSKNKEDELDEESRAGLNRINQRDQEVDRGIHEISRGLDNLAAIAGSMKEEVRKLYSQRWL